jgi:hypothetical protein
MLWIGIAAALTVGADGRLWRDGAPHVIVEANSPENRARHWIEDREAERARLRYLAAAGVNTVWWSLWCGDDPGVRLTDGNFAEYRALAEEIAALGMVSHVALTERETHRIPPDAERRAHYARAARLFAGIDGDAIFCLGEELYATDPLAAWETMLREELARAGVAAPVSAHNWPGEQPWRGTTVDLIAWQGEDSAALARIADRPAYPCERMPWHTGIPTDANGGLAIGLRWFWDAQPAAAGAGVYAGWSAADGCGDLACPQPQAHDALWRALAASASIAVSGGDADAARVLGVPVPGGLDGPDGVWDAADCLP